MGTSKSQGFEIRRLKTSDLQKFLELGLPTCAFMHGRPDLSESKLRQNFAGFVREHFESDESDIFIAEDPYGHYAGQLWLHSTRNRFNGRHELWIWDITVAPEFRHKGLGKQLLEFAKQQATNRHIEELWLLVSSLNDVAISLYRTSGLRRLGELMCLPLEGEVQGRQTMSFGATILRPLASSDVSRLHELWTASGLPFRPRGRDSTSRLRVFLNDARESGWCTEADSKLTGAALITDDGRKGWIERLAVHPDFRRAGLAKAIVTACMASLKSRGLLIIGALVEEENNISRALFEGCGFEHQSRIGYFTFRENKNC